MDSQYPCPICQNKKTSTRFQAKILKNYHAIYRWCTPCHFLFIQQPNWLEEAYADPITASDTGILARNQILARDTAIVAYFFFQRERKYLDYAGGYGILTRIMRDIGFDFYWHDPYCQNLFATGFEHPATNDMYEMITCFEVLEHLQNPLEDMQRLLEITDAILIHTIFLPDPVPEPQHWHYYGLDHGQHISFYSRHTLTVMADLLGCQTYRCNKNLFLFTRKKINNVKLRFLLTLSRRRLFTYVKRHMRSLTETDSQQRDIQGKG